MISINQDNTVSLMYRKKKLMDVVKLEEIKWRPARGTDKWFCPPSNSPDNSTSRFSKPHTVKGFVDDITVISYSKEDHKSAFQEI